MPIVARYTGNGTVREGDHEIARVTYAFVEDREVRDGIPRFSEHYGTITLIDGTLITQNNWPLTLVLEDGRKIDFLFRDVPTPYAGGSYRVQMTGSFTGP